MRNIRITDVNDNTQLQDCSVAYAVMPGLTPYPIVEVKRLNFLGTPTELLRKHGLLCLVDEKNALEIESEYKRHARLQTTLGK